jgi:hypothetical protein
MMFLATGKKEGRRRTTTLCFQIRVRYTVLTSSIPSGPLGQRVVELQS